MNRTLILGVGGQDGSLLADLLLSQGIEVHGVVRRSSLDNRGRIRHLLEGTLPDGTVYNRELFRLHTADLCDGSSVDRVVQMVEPLDVYNLADQDHVGTSHDCPGLSVEVTYAAVGRLLESVLSLERRTGKTRKVFQACSATMFGLTPGPQDEDTWHDPRSPYAVAKTAAYHLGRHYRDRHGLFVTNGILFNHDSDRRGGDYLLHKVVRGVWGLRRGVGRLPLQNPDLRVDIGSAREFVTGFQKLLALGRPVDVCVGTGLAWPVRRMVRHACELVFGIGSERWDEKVDWSESKHPEPFLLCDPSRLKGLTGWVPTTGSLMVIRELVDHYEDKP